ASRMLAAKTSLAARFDALGEDTQLALGVEHKAYLEKRMRELEEGGNRRISAGKKKDFSFSKYENKSEIRQYSAAADTTVGKRKLKIEESNGEGVKTEDASPVKKKIKLEEEEEAVEEETPKKKKKKDKKVKEEPVEPEPEPMEEVEAEPPKKKKKKSKVEVEPEPEPEPEPQPEKKKKKKKKKDEDE
ncbi:unnamed protein product, partial [Allacma fusca]